MPDRLTPAAERLLRKLGSLPTGLVVDSVDREVAEALMGEGLAYWAETAGIRRYLACDQGRAYIAALDRERQAAAEGGLRV